MTSATLIVVGVLCLLSLGLNRLFGHPWLRSLALGVLGLIGIVIGLVWANIAAERAKSR